MSDVNEAEMEQFVDGVGGVTLTVIDTPGFLATQRRCGNSHDGLTSDTDALLQQFFRALVYAKDVVDAVLITLRCAEPASMEEEALLQFLDDMRIWKHCIVLFTHGAQVSDGKDEGYLELHERLKSGEFARESPVLSKLIENCNKRFLIVESVDKAGDKHYHRSKLDELYSAVETTRKNAESAFNHPLLVMAQNSYKMIQMQKDLKKEADDKDAQLEATMKEKDAVTKRLNKLQNALEPDPPNVNNDAIDKQDMEDAAAMLIEYLRGSEATEASPDRFVSAFRRLEAAERKQREMMAKLGDLMEGIRSERKRRLPRADIERELEAIMTPRPVDVNATEGQPGRRQEERNWCPLF